MESIPDAKQQLEGVPDDVVHRSAQEQPAEHLGGQRPGQVLRDADGGAAGTGVIGVVKA